MIFKRIIPLLLTIGFTLSCQKDGSEKSSDIYQAAPANSVILVETDQFLQALQDISKTSLYQEVDSVPAFFHFQEKVKPLYTLFNADSLSEFFDSRPVLIAQCLSGAEKYNTLFISKGDAGFEKKLGKVLSKKFTASKKTYAETTIFSFSQTTNSDEQYFVSTTHGLILMSTQSNLVEESIRQLKSGMSLTDDPAFKKLQQTSNKKDLANVYVNIQALPDWISILLPNSKPSPFKRMGKWAELDLQVYNKELILSGLLLLPPEEKHYLSSLAQSKKLTSTGQEIIPKNSGLWLSQTFSNAEKNHRAYTSYLQGQGRLRKYEKLLEKIPFNHNESLLNWVDTEMGLFTAAGQNGRVNYLAYFKFRDEEMAKIGLDSIAKPDFVNGYRGMIIKKVRFENALPRFYGSMFNNLHYPYYTLINGYALFAEEEIVLKGAINDILDEKTLAKDVDFVAFSEKIPNKSHLKVIATNPGCFSLLSELLGKSDAQWLEKNQQQLSNLRWAALQVDVNSADAAFINLYVNHDTPKKESVVRLWNVPIGTNLSREPQLVKNHSNSKYDVVVQDDKNVLHLVNYKGELKWSTALDGPILGEIQQVDLFKNNKLQMVFNTTSQLYVLDRLGRNVENFPVKLAAKATAPAGIFDYDKARNYRMVVPVGSKLYNYSIEGKQVKGWNNKSHGSDLISKPQHFAVAGKDVIVVLGKDGTLRQLNRKGEERFKGIKDLPQLQSPFFIKTAKTLAKSEILANGADGKLYAIHPGGTTDALFLDSDKPADYFVYFDDKYVFAHDENLIVKSSEKPWSVELNNDISALPKVMIFGREFYAAAYSEHAQEISLFTKNGELVDGFPIFAQGPFDMGSLKQDGSINIVTLTDDGSLVCYRVQ